MQLYTVCGYSGYFWDSAYFFSELRKLEKIIPYFFLGKNAGLGIRSSVFQVNCSFFVKERAKV